MEDEQHEFDLVAFVILFKSRKKHKRRTIWTKSWPLKRNIYTHTNLLEELRVYPEDFNNFLRMDEATYLYLLRIVSPKIERQSIVMREAISPHQRLTATLRFLATGANYQDLKFSACISAPSLCQIIPETCSAIYDAVVADYMNVSKSIYSFHYKY